MHICSLATVLLIMLKTFAAMNLKRIFGTLLTILGIIGLIYSAIEFVNGSEFSRSMIVYLILGIVFFFTGIGLIRGTSDSAKM